MIDRRAGPRRKGRRAARAASAVGALGLLLAGCGEPAPSPTVGSNSNWLSTCGADADCERGLECRCGACTRSCEAHADCSALAGARCLLEDDVAVRAHCQEDAALDGGMCRPRCEAGTCPEGWACALDACTPLVLPDAAACGDLPPLDADERAQQDTLIDVVERARQDGTIACAGGAAAPATDAAWIDARLFCAARLLAVSVAAGQASGLVDAEGRTTTDRMSLAGFPAGAWAEGYALSAATAPEAWSTMLEDDDFCAAAGNAELSSLGVGVSGDAYVVTLGAP